MSAPDRLPDEALDSLLDGSPSEEALGTPLAAYLAEVREDALATTPSPSQDLAMVLEEGLEPADLANAGAAGADDARRGILTWRLRGRTLARALVTKLAALGVLGKAAVAGAAVTVAASSAGAAGVLPEPAQGTFDDAIGRDVQEAPADLDEQSGTSETGSDADTPPETPADTADTPPLETDVPGDATGSEDGDEPGVDGKDVAEDASGGASTAPEDTPGDDAKQEPPADADTQPAENASGDAPAGDVPANDASATEDAGDGGAAGPGDDERPPSPPAGVPADSYPRS